jgi:hypothetical protein
MKPISRRDMLAAATAGGLAVAASTTGAQSTEPLRNARVMEHRPRPAQSDAGSAEP